MKDTTPTIPHIFALQKDGVAARRVTFDYTARMAALAKLEAMVWNEREAIAEAIHSDFGKHPNEVMLTEILPLMVEFRQTTKNLRRWMRPKRYPAGRVFMGTTTKAHPTPKGAALVIGPWNFPLLLSLGPVISALAAGCSVTLKPSEMTPATSALIHRMITATFPQDLLAVVEGGVEVSTKLLELPYDHIFFTGSPEVGQIVMTAAAKTLATVTLELGGKTPAIVGPDADIKKAARWIAWGKLLNGGQACVCVDHLYVHESIKEEFLAELTRQIERMARPSPFSSDDIARIAHHRHWTHLSDLIADARTKGATFLMGGQTDEAALKIAPTVLLDLRDDMDIQQREIFGPVLPVMPYNDLDNVITKMNAGPHPLNLYLFGGRDLSDKVIAHTNSGNVAVNLSVMVFAHPSATFGGVGRSGNGGAHGYAGFAAFTHMRQVLTARFFPFHLYFPPYTKTSKRLIRVLERLLHRGT